MLSLLSGEWQVGSDEDESSWGEPPGSRQGILRMVQLPPRSMIMLLGRIPESRCSNRGLREPEGDGLYTGGCQVPFRSAATKPAVALLVIAGLQDRDPPNCRAEEHVGATGLVTVGAESFAQFADQLGLAHSRGSGRGEWRRLWQGTGTGGE